MDKGSIRREVKKRVAQMSAEEKSAASRRIFGQVAASDEFRRAEVVAVYASLADEPQTAEFISEWQGCKRIVLPRVEGDVMRFYDYAPERMRKGAFGISEPVGDVPCPPENIDFMVVPAVAFTRAGERLGRGRGFYDRYLSQAGFRAYTVGVCFSVQFADELPSEPFDVAVCKVISDS